VVVVETEEEDAELEVEDDDVIIDDVLVGLVVEDEL